MDLTGVVFRKKGTTFVASKREDDVEVLLYKDGRNIGVLLSEENIRELLDFLVYEVVDNGKKKSTP